jgi:uncharacterized protein (UPF0332 family)
MLDIDAVDLADLALALEDHSAEHTWLLDPASGVVAPRFGAALEDALGAVPDGAVAIGPLPVAVGYGDMEDFVAYVRDVRARDLLERAIVGRGAFRRFKDALAAFPELRRAWFAFHDARGERRAIEWLADRGLVDALAANAALATRADPEPGDLPGLLDAEGLARRVALDLRRVYRRRLRAVLLTGAWAHGDAHPESAVEVLVVLDGFGDRWAERRRMERTLWRHSVRNDAVVTALPVMASELGALRGGDDDGARAISGAVALPEAGAASAVAAGRLSARAREDLAAARVLLDAGFGTQAVCCASRAALLAAESMLAAAGVRPATPAGVVAAFTHHLLCGAEDTAPDHARALRRLYEDHAILDLGLDEPTPAEAAEALAAAAAILDAVTPLLATR